MTNGTRTRWMSGVAGAALMTAVAAGGMPALADHHMDNSRTTYEEVKDYSVEKKNDLVRWYHRQMEALDENYEAVKEKSGENWDAISADLAEKKKAVAAKLDAAGDATAEQWENIKQETAEAYEDLREAYDDAVEEDKKE